MILRGPGHFQACRAVYMCSNTGATVRKPCSIHILCKSFIAFPLHLLTIIHVFLFSFSFLFLHLPIMKTIISSSNVGFDASSDIGHSGMFVLIPLSRRANIFTIMVSNWVAAFGCDTYECRSHVCLKWPFRAQLRYHGRCMARKMETLRQLWCVDLSFY